MMLASGGCAGPDRRVEVSSSFVKVQSHEEVDQLFECTQDVLRRQRFPLDRVDRRGGVVTTLPVISQSLLEFWRHDVDTPKDLWESTLNPIRRWVEASVHRDAAAGTVTVAFVVHKERLSSPDRQFNSSGAAYQFFGESLPSTEGLTRVTAEHDVWIDLGRDPAMESYLLRKVLERSGAVRTEDARSPESPS